MLYKENCHVLNNRFKMETLKHLRAKSLYARSKNSNWCYSVNGDFLSDKSIYMA